MQPRTSIGSSGRPGPAPLPEGIPTEFLLPAPRGVRGRLAPSPTGLLHLGNAWAFLLAWLGARSAGGEIILRMEDIDPQRSRPEHADAIVEDLRRLGLDWDAGPGARAESALAGTAPSPAVPPAASRGAWREGRPAFFYQGMRGAAYAAALDALSAAGRTYPCFCTRRDVRQAAAAPHVDDRGAPYSGACRRLAPERRDELLAAGRRPGIRLICDGEKARFEDMLLGPQEISLRDCGGDFILRRSDGVFAYHLATALDDALMGVNEVARGRDILPSTPRQLLILRLLGLPVPRHAHFPLILDEEGGRLAKRHASLSLRALFDAGVRPEEVTGLLGRWAGCNPSGAPAHPRDLLPAFSWGRVPAEDVIFRTCDLLRR